MRNSVEKNTNVEETFGELGLSILGQPLKRPFENDTTRNEITLPTKIPRLTASLTSKELDFLSSGSSLSSLSSSPTSSQTDNINGLPGLSNGHLEISNPEVEKDFINSTSNKSENGLSSLPEPPVVLNLLAQSNNSNVENLDHENIHGIQPEVYNAYGRRRNLRVRNPEQINPYKYDRQRLKGVIGDKLFRYVSRGLEPQEKNYILPSFRELGKDHSNFSSSRKATPPETGKSLSNDGETMPIVEETNEFFSIRKNGNTNLAENFMNQPSTEPGLESQNPVAIRHTATRRKIIHSDSSDESEVGNVNKYTKRHSRDSVSLGIRGTRKIESLHGINDPDGSSSDSSIEFLATKMKNNENHRALSEVPQPYSTNNKVLENHISSDSESSEVNGHVPNFHDFFSDSSVDFETSGAENFNLTQNFNSDVGLSQQSLGFSQITSDSGVNQRNSHKIPEQPHISEKRIRNSSHSYPLRDPPEIDQMISRKRNTRSSKDAKVSSKSKSRNPSGPKKRSSIPIYRRLMQESSKSRYPTVYSENPTSSNSKSIPKLPVNRHSNETISPSFRRQETEPQLIQTYLHAPFQRLQQRRSSAPKHGSTHNSQLVQEPNELEEDESLNNKQVVRKSAKPPRVSGVFQLGPEHVRQKQSYPVVDLEKLEHLKQNKFLATSKTTERISGSGPHQSMRGKSRKVSTNAIDISDNQSDFKQTEPSESRSEKQQDFINENKTDGLDIMSHPELGHKPQVDNERYDRVRQWLSEAPAGVQDIDSKPDYSDSILHEHDDISSNDAETDLSEMIFMLPYDEDFTFHKASLIGSGTFQCILAGIEPNPASYWFESFEPYLDSISWSGIGPQFFTDVDSFFSMIISWLQRYNVSETQYDITLKFFSFFIRFLIGNYSLLDDDDIRRLLRSLNVFIGDCIVYSTLDKSSHQTRKLALTAAVYSFSSITLFFRIPSIKIETHSLFELIAERLCSILLDNNHFNLYRFNKRAANKSYLIELACVFAQCLNKASELTNNEDLYFYTFLDTHLQKTATIAKKKWEIFISFLSVLSIKIPNTYSNNNFNWNFYSSMAREVINNFQPNNVTSIEYTYIMIYQGLLLITRWNWSSNRGFIELLFGFFSNRNYNNIEGVVDKKILELLSDNEYIPNMDDTCYSLFLKIFAVSVKRFEIEKNYHALIIIDVLNPLNGIQYPRDKRLQKTDLQALENQYCLLLLRIKIAPPRFRPSLDQVTEFVNPYHVHNSARHVILGAWNESMSIQITKNRRLEKSVHWFNNLINKTIVEYLALKKTNVTSSDEKWNLRQNLKPFENFFLSAFELLKNWMTVSYISHRDWPLLLSKSEL